jgi:hypothetical protein
VFLRVCEGLILKWQRAHFDNLNRGGKRASAGGQIAGDDVNRSKRTRSEPGAYATGDNIPKHNKGKKMVRLGLKTAAVLRLS